MSLFGFFRRRPPIRSIAELADFIDQNSAFLAQKGIYEFARARAGHYSKVLFHEADFKQAAEVARWRAYPLGLAMVGEAVEAALRPFVGDERQKELDALSALVLSIFDRYPVPAALGAPTWAALREELARQLGLIGTHAPKRIKDIPERFAETYCALMPIHEKLRESDHPTMRNYLRVTLCNIHDELVQRTDLSAIAALLCRTAEADADGVA